MGADDYQALTAHQKKDRSKGEDHPHKTSKRFQKNRSQRDYSNLRCFTCDEKGHFAKHYPRNKGSTRTNKKKRHHAHTAEDDEPISKGTSEDSSSDEEYVLISAIIGIVTHGRNYWLVDSGGSKHMTGYKYSLINLLEQESPHKVKLGDDY